MRNKTRGCFFSLLLIFVSACAPSLTEIQRLSDSEAMLDAVIAERETDATVDTPTELYVVSHAAAVSGEPVLRMDKVDSLRVTWESDRNLTAHAETARVFLYVRELALKDARGNSRTISIRLNIKNLLLPKAPPNA
ncbi:hypothetical protein [Massilia sp. METH4]|uniref:hypothetical protein n=1 Tax=Massilia sp. METH4 TaxID=3123041 RepID=UPI0030CD48E4